MHGSVQMRNMLSFLIHHPQPHTTLKVSFTDPDRISSLNILEFYTLGVVVPKHDLNFQEP